MSGQSRRGSLFAFISLVAAFACVESSPTDPTGPGRLAYVSGDSQTIVAGTAAAPFVVKVTRADGQPLASTSVTWAVDSGGGTLDVASSVTDANGLARATYTGPTKVGTANVLAYVTNLPGLLTRFSVKLKSDVASSLTSAGGNGAATLTEKSLVLVAKAADKNGNGVSGVRVTWASGTGGTVAAIADTTDANGLARATFTVGAAPGKYSATASATSLGTTTFTVDAITASSVENSLSRGQSR